MTAAVEYVGWVRVDLRYWRAVCTARSADACRDLLDRCNVDRDESVVLPDPLEPNPGFAIRRA